MLYQRYADDIICLFNCEADTMNFFSLLEPQTPEKTHIWKTKQWQVTIFWCTSIKWKWYFFKSVFRKKSCFCLKIILFFHHSSCRTYFIQKIFCQLLGSPMLYTNFLVEDVNPVTLWKPNAIYLLRSRNNRKLIQNLTFLNTSMRILIAEIYVIPAAS